ncbi:MAG: exodeoxyribonuclease VII large subunit [Dehalococcoidia bacterium]|nr:exodeoxyribonuclease VII large subunit [Dehalococcoidia bacterium]
MAFIYGVSQVTAYLRELLAYDDVLADIWIEGEVSNLRRPGSGHAYFTLRDSQSSLRGVLFRNLRGLEHLQDGAAVVAHGRVSLYEVRGDLQLIADVVQPEGVGELQMRLEQLTLQLEREGLFDPSRKRPLPEIPRRIGVVTSPTGSVWHDIQSVVGRRWPLVELLLAPAMVQGDGAAPTIVEAFAALNGEPEVDVIIVARGGGSLEDLWPFNEESVARAVFASQTPVVSAIGHETDFTICDMVADIRAPTPSAAAELVVPDRAEMLARVVGAAQFIESSLATQLDRASDEVDALRSRVGRAAPELDGLRLRVDDLLQTSQTALSHRVELLRARVAGLSSALSPLSPYGTLRRGYAIVSSRNSDEVITDSQNVTTGDILDVTLHRGSVIASVESSSDRTEER